MLIGFVRFSFLFCVCFSVIVFLCEICGFGIFLGVIGVCVLKGFVVRVEMFCRIGCMICCFRFIDIDVIVNISSKF